MKLRIIDIDQHYCDDKMKDVAVAVCSRCTVAVECGSYAATEHVIVGVWKSTRPHANVRAWTSCSASLREGDVGGRGGTRIVEDARPTLLRFCGRTRVSRDGRRGQTARTHQIGQSDSLCRIGCAIGPSNGTCAYLPSGTRNPLQSLFRTSAWRALNHGEMLT